MYSYYELNNLAGRLPYMSRIRVTIKKQAYADFYGKAREPWYKMVFWTGALVLAVAWLAIRVNLTYYIKIWRS